MTITLLAPHSKEYKKAQHEQITKQINKAQKDKKYYNKEDAKAEIEPRPRIFLRDAERLEAESRWGERKEKSKRIILAPGGGFPEKCWGDDNFSTLLQIFLEQTDHKIAIIGSREDKKRVQAFW